jgi:hypothetical protein
MMTYPLSMSALTNAFTKRSRQFLTSIFLVGLLSACSTPDTQRFQTDPSQPQTAETTRTIYADRTFLTHGPHGTQIEYHDKSGISHLWYPGNSSGVPARWKVEMESNGHDICWKYPSRSYNPLTQKLGGSWGCSPDRFYFPKVVQIIGGDPFRLHTGRIPFRLPRGKFLAEELAKQAGVSNGQLKIIYDNR